MAAARATCRPVRPWETKTATALQSAFTFTANATNKSNEQQVNSTCFEKEPPEKAHRQGHIAQEPPGSAVIDSNWITDDWSAASHKCFCNMPTTILQHARNQRSHLTLRKYQLDAACGELAGSLYCLRRLKNVFMYVLGGVCVCVEGGEMEKEKADVLVGKGIKCWALSVWPYTSWTTFRPLIRLNGKPSWTTGRQQDTTQTGKTSQGKKKKRRRRRKGVEPGCCRQVETLQRYGSLWRQIRHGQGYLKEPLSGKSSMTFISWGDGGTRWLQRRPGTWERGRRLMYSHSHNTEQFLSWAI